MEFIKSNTKAFLVGDNPFHNISHLSQERASSRDFQIVYPKRAADLILASVDNGANGFMFSVSETTLSILKELRNRQQIDRLSLHAIVPYAYEYIQLSTQLGGISALARKVAKQLVLSGNLKMIGAVLLGYFKSNPVSFLQAYVRYEIERVISSAGKKEQLDSLILHEVLTDLGLAINMEWLFRNYINLLKDAGITPGFNTVNFEYLVKKFREWKIDLDSVEIVSPFNKIGFQMTPSKERCEQILRTLNQPVVVAISVLAAGYLKPEEAVEYIASLPNIKGLAVGVSNEKHVRETFGIIKEKLEINNKAAKNV